ncbi:hypothetical protein [Vibrio cincinnatiensis]|uniref:hypothetical protein n=1 Tax=Vibrio cincinnatiensis TaxID=675 RepID=UPI001EDE1C78|nr:hypothetical protein [Vibrio cincinnatiensis]MCG3741597.1 hypothetical protein [Vibrio cincinnatiensis]
MLDDLGELVESTINEWIGRNVATAYKSDAILKDRPQKPMLEIVIQTGEKQLVGNVLITSATKIVLLNDGSFAEYSSETKPTGHITYTGTENIPEMQTTLKLTAIHSDACDRFPLLLRELVKDGETSFNLESIAAEIADTAIEIHSNK